MRDMLGTKKLIEWKFRNEEVEFLKDNTWQFTEKVDWTNIRIYWDGHRVSFAGRTDNAQLPWDLYKFLYDTFWGERNEELFEQKYGETPVMLFGEWYGEGIQSWWDYRKWKGFILFDVLINNMWLKREDVEWIATMWWIPVVPIVFEWTIAEAVSYVKAQPKSMISINDKLSEWLVWRPKCEIKDRRGNRIIVKVKVCDFNE